jgi:hypoxanthine phosphoribosyltransferase
VPPEDAKGRRVALLHSARAVDERIDALAAEVAAALSARTPLVVVIAEGARRFAARLVRGLEARGFAPERTEVRAQRSQGTELREVVLDGCDASVFSGREVIITDDIADECRTLEAVGALVRSGAPRSVRVAVLVSKPVRRRVPVQLDHVGFEVGSGYRRLRHDGRRLYRELTGSACSKAREASPARSDGTVECLGRHARDGANGDMHLFTIEERP